MPLYLAKLGQGENLQEFLVEASNKQVAQNHVARKVIEVEKASQADLFRLAKAGAEIEVATGAAEVQEALDASADTTAAGAIEGANAALEAGGDARDVAAAAIGGAAAGAAEAKAEAPKPKK